MRTSVLVYVCGRHVARVLFFLRVQRDHHIGDRLPLAKTTLPEIATGGGGGGFDFVQPDTSVMRIVAISAAAHTETLKSHSGQSGRGVTSRCQGWRRRAAAGPLSQVGCEMPSSPPARCRRQGPPGFPLGPDCVRGCRTAICAGWSGTHGVGLLIPVQAEVMVKPRIEAMRPIRSQSR